MTGSTEGKQESERGARERCELMERQSSGPAAAGVVQRSDRSDVNGGQQLPSKQTTNQQKFSPFFSG